MLRQSVDVVFYGKNNEKGDFNYYKEYEVLSYDGDIYDGFSDDFIKKYTQSENIKIVMIKSDGGWAAEAERVYDFLKPKAITTLSKYCYSACNYIFAAGKEREALHDAVFGFHSSSTSYNQEIKKMDIKKINIMYGAASVNQEFIDKVIDIPHKHMWEPSLNYLMKVGFLTKVVAE